MIAHINGTVDFIGKDHLVIDANGIGYKVFVSPQIIASLGIIRSKVKIFTEQIVREDSLSLYGFQMKEEKALFNSLLGVSGIGPKSAMSIISGLPFDSLVSAIAGGKGDVISSIPGVGLKTAQRLIIELKEKVVKLYGANPDELAGELSLINKSNVSDAISALVSLGYSPKEAKASVTKGNSQDIDSLSAEEIIKKALKELS